MLSGRNTSVSTIMIASQRPLYLIFISFISFISLWNVSLARRSLIHESQKTDPYMRICNAFDDHNANEISESNQHIFDKYCLVSGLLVAVDEQHRSTLSVPLRSSSFQTLDL